jgi:pimeloyl-ACP methyl ester carboxylesterase
MADTLLHEGRVMANEIEFGYLEAGSGPLALCLHGFPDTARTWRHLLPALADAGFHAVAPWMRGYAPSGLAPDGCYQTGALVADALALHDALDGDGDAVIIGHDWGAFATYGAAAHAPDRWRRVVTAAVPSATALASGFFTYDQVRRSFYIFFFQNPLTDLVVPMNDLEFLARLWQDWSPSYDATEDMGYVRDSIGKPENLAAAIGYYRAMFDSSSHLERYEAEQLATTLPTPQPLLYLHGVDDGCLGVDMTAGVEASFTVQGSRVEHVAEAGHFVHLDRPDLVNALIVDFVRT